MNDLTEYPANLYDFPALTGRTVTQGHADKCRDQGHATWTFDGDPSEYCPRCGELV